MSSDPAGEQINGGWAIINGGPCPCCGQAEGNMCRCAAFASLLAEKDAEIERLAMKLKKADARICVSCLESHPLDSPCPPHEMRSSGPQWFRERLAAKDAEVAGWLRTSQVQDERIDELRAERDRLAAEVERLQRELAAAHEESAKRGSEILDLQQENAELRKWKDAIEEAAVVNWTLNSENADNPTKAIQDLIACIMREALDPMCSKPAAELHERIQALEKENVELRQRAERFTVQGLSEAIGHYLVTVNEEWKSESGQYPIPPTMISWLCGGAAKAAIDAAMKDTT